MKKANMLILGVFLALYLTVRVPYSVSAYGTYSVTTFNTNDTVTTEYFNETNETSYRYFSILRSANLSSMDINIDVHNVLASGNLTLYIPEIGISHEYLNGTVYYREGFEDSDHSDWTQPGTNAYVTTPQNIPFRGDEYLRMFGHPAGGDDYIRSPDWGTVEDGFELSFAFIINDSNAGNVRLYIQATDNTSLGYLDFKFNGNEIKFNNMTVSYSDIGQYTSNTWQHMRIISDFETMEILLDKTPEVAGGWESLGNYTTTKTDNISSMYVQLANGGAGRLCLDNIILRNNTYSYGHSETWTISDMVDFNDYLVDNCTSDWNTGLCNFTLNITLNTSKDGLVFNDTRIFGPDITLNITVDGEYTYGLYDIGIFDEITLEDFNATTMTLILLCQNDTQEITITDYYNPSFVVDCKLNHMKLEVNDTNGNSHYRTLKPDAGYNQSVKFYMINETDNTARGQQYIIYDITSKYYNGTGVVYKVLPSLGKTTMIERTIDAENKLTFWLIDGEEYSIFLISENGLETRSIGDIEGDSDTEKNIMVSDVPYDPEQLLTFQDVIIYFSYDMTGNIIRGHYNDTLGHTSSIVFTVYNASNISQVMYTDTSTESVVTFTYNGVTWNNSYIAEITAIHTDFGTIQERRTIGEESRYMVPTITGMGYGIYMSIAAGLICVFSMLAFDKKFAEVGIIFSILLMALFMYWGWFEASPQVGWGTITLLAFLAFANMLALRRRNQ